VKHVQNRNESASADQENPNDLESMPKKQHHECKKHCDTRFFSAKMGETQPLLGEGIRSQ